MNITWYPGQRQKIDRAVRAALEQTAEAVRTDLYKSQTIPRDTGELQENTTVDASQVHHGKVSVVSSRPYARRLYFHPKYKFRTDKNRFAGGMWFQPYLEGNGKKWVERTFAALLKRNR